MIGKSVACAAIPGTEVTETPDISADAATVLCEKQAWRSAVESTANYTHIGGSCFDMCKLPHFLEGKPLPEGYSDPPNPYRLPPTCPFHLRRLVAYAREKGVAVTDLTWEETEMFRRVPTSFCGEKPTKQSAVRIFRTAEMVKIERGAVTIFHVPTPSRVALHKTYCHRRWRGRYG